MFKYQGETGKEEVDKQIKNLVNLDHLPKIKGFDFSNTFHFNEFINAYTHMGFQGSNVGQAITLLKEILEKRKKGLKLYLAFTGNMVSSGNREIITYLIKEKVVDGIVTAAAAIEEDVMKCIKPFHLGTFQVKGESLLDSSVGRIGNIFVPADRYLYLERFMNEAFPLALEKQKQQQHPLAPHELTKLIGEHISNNKYTKESKEQSFLYWAAQHSIPVFCPAITDGALGDLSTFFKANNKEFAIDITEENQKLTKELLDAEETACLILGGGAAKHFLLNAAIFREGFEHAIYITTATYFDGSDSGGNQEEAITWAKVKPNAQRIKVIADATIVFPLVVAGALYK